jgi:hypothetical protein
MLTGGGPGQVGGASCAVGPSSPPTSPPPTAPRLPTNLRPVTQTSPDLPQPSPLRAFLLWIAGITAVGFLVRALHLDIPIRYDEAHTFLEYARHGVRYVVSTYEHPNNHVFHSLLVALSTGGLGEGLVAIRLPAFLAGCLLVPTAGLLAWRGGVGAPARSSGAFLGGLLAAALVAGWPVLVEYSTNARGYSIVGLVTLLVGWVAVEIRGGGGGGRWWVLGALGAVGMFTVPVMLLPWTAVLLYLGHARLSGVGAGERVRALSPVLLLAGGVGVVTLLLYLPILAVHGIGAFLDERYIVVAQDGGMLSRFPGDLAGVFLHWSKELPAAVLVFVLAGLLGEAIHSQGRRAPSQLLLWCLIVSFGFLFLRGTQGYERVWLWLLPLVLVVAAQGWSLILARVGASAPGGLHPAAGGAALLLAITMGAVTSLGGELRGSLETGGYPEGPEVARYLAGAMGPQDIVLTDFISVGPLAYYRERLGGSGAGGGAPGGPHAWIVMNRSEQQRVDHLLEELAEDGLDLARVPTVETIGDTWIHRVRMAR